MLIIVAICFLGVAALGGLTMAVMHFLGKTPPPGLLAVFHGVLAVTGVVVLSLAVWPNFSGLAAWALWLFVLAALGGLTLALGFHMRGKPLPSPLIAGHGSLAVLAFLILLVAAYRQLY